MNKFMRTMTAAAVMAMVGFAGQTMATELVVVHGVVLILQVSRMLTMPLI